MSDDRPKKTHSGIDAYRRTDVITANKETLLLMMYAGATRFLKMAIEASERNDISEKGKYIGKTQQIVTELRATLNHEASQEIASALESLYDFIMQRLLKGMMDKNSDPLKEALNILNTLQSAWEEAIALLNNQKSQAK